MYGHQFYLCNQDELEPWLTNCCMSLLCFNIKICVQSRRFISFFFLARVNIVEKGKYFVSWEFLIFNGRYV
ncbi:hypothetical protein GLYMA_13G037200v4 [Glycine max]|uniref:Uncharacterized protein n=1 Tax=Glycine max TaxID=3847 RepID=A0A0R0GI46_SOYBN|nr:hypothetical protein JHK86_035314 [Glycine max]KAH1099681.1 hypothetical protein GYH30_035037 [Glycine max]KRH18096.1 hypothetical protein GLYMA_13G037200v4 [Glycine max]